jgi:hypothetical protein
MRRDLRASVARARRDDEDATVVDFAAPDRARRDLASIYEDETVARPLPFDDLPTTVWTPRTAPPAGGVSRSRVTIRRRLQSVVDDEPSVRVEASHPAWSDRDEVTRIEVLREIPPAEEKTAPGQAQLRAAAASARSPVRIACAVLLGLLAVALVAGWYRAHPHALAFPVAAPLAVPAPLPAPAPVPARVSPAPNPVAAPVPARPPAAAPVPLSAPRAPETTASGAPSAAVPAGDEFSAVEAVQSGDLRRAARLYSALAASHPANDAYREAARILLEGTKESHP